MGNTDRGNLFGRKERIMTWYTGSPPENGEYLVTVRIRKRNIVQVDYWLEPIGFVDWHDDVLAWAYLPDPWGGGTYVV